MHKVAAWTLAFALLAGAEGVVNEEWAAKDVEAARRIAGALGETEISKFLEKLKASDAEEDRDIGFLARRLRLAVYGGHTTTWVTVVSWKDAVGPVEVRCHEGDAETWAALRDRIKAEYKGFDPEVGDAGLRVRVGARAGPDGFREGRNEVLGPPLGIDPHPALSDAYLLLWSPTSDLVYGWMYGEDGAPPPGRDAVEKILAHEHGRALLEDILRGPNPEGRLYAAEALLRLEKKGGKLGEQEKRDIEWVRKSSVKIHVARGCEVSWEPAEAPLKEMLEDAP
ncbi:MAG TPA: hypothetical protein VFY93_09480 [Planctomycetota bacterium]|nr:hypothetical protein [Planctomycetota bacterium]